jgi:hypothetical protein
MADWFDLTRCEHAFGLGEPRLLVYRHQRPDAEEEPVTMPSTNIPVQAAPAWLMIRHAVVAGSTSGTAGHGRCDAGGR